MTLVTALGEERGLNLFREIARRNGLSARRGHTLLSNLVISGEVPLALNVYLHEVASVRQAGAPIQEVYLSPTVAQMGGGAVMKRAPHPHAAVLFLDFVLSDGQKIWADLKRVPTNLTYQRLPAGVKLSFIDPDKYVAESAKWERLYREIVTSRAR
jgi:iron(III) transport system substrate-binding protein